MMVVVVVVVVLLQLLVFVTDKADVVGVDLCGAIARCAFLSTPVYLCIYGLGRCFFFFLFVLFVSLSLSGERRYLIARLTGRLAFLVAAEPPPPPPPHTTSLSKQVHEQTVTLSSSTSMFFVSSFLIATISPPAPPPLRLRLCTLAIPVIVLSTDRFVLFAGIAVIDVALSATSCCSS